MTRAVGAEVTAVEAAVPCGTPARAAHGADEEAPIR